MTGRFCAPAFLALGRRGAARGLTSLVSSGSSSTINSCRLLNDHKAIKTSANSTMPICASWCAQGGIANCASSQSMPTSTGTMAYKRHHLGFALAFMFNGSFLKMEWHTDENAVARTEEQYPLQDAHRLVVQQQVDAPFGNDLRDHHHDIRIGVVGAHAVNVFQQRARDRAKGRLDHLQRDRLA